MKLLNRNAVYIILFLIFILLIGLGFLYLRTSKNGRNLKKSQSDTISKYNQIYTKFYNFEDTWDTKISKVVSRSGHNSLMLYPGGEYCSGLVMKYSDIQKEITPIEITASIYVYTESDLKINPVNLVFEVDDNDKKIDYFALNSEDIANTRKGWNELYNRQTIKNITSLDNVVKVYAYYRGKEKVYVDDLLVTIFRITR